jgi:hypothetical protein
MSKAHVLAFYQSSPDKNPEIKAVLSCDETGKVFMQTISGKKPYRGTVILNKENVPVVPKGNGYLKLLGQTSTVSQITFLYTEDLELVSKYLETLKA